MQSGEFLKRRGETWWFRRKVPSALTGILGKREIAVSLRTGLKREAEGRGRIAWAWSERAFSVARGGTSIAREQALVLLRRLARDEPWHGGELTEYARQAQNGDGSHLRSLLEHASDDILVLPPDERNRVMLHISQWSEMLDAADRDGLAKAERSDNQNDVALARARIHLAALKRVEGLGDLIRGLEARAAQPQPEHRLSDFQEAFLADKTRTTREHDGYSEQTAVQTRATFRLWGDLSGDPPVKSVGRREAGRFRDDLLRLPAAHGKSTGGRGDARPAPLPASEAIRRADEREKQGTVVPRLSMKTTKRHFSAMQQAWKWLLRRGEVSENPFSGWEFPGTKAGRRQRDDWSEDDLVRILTSEAMRQAASNGSRDFWLVALGMWAGLRLEEICRIRPSRDIYREDGSVFLLVQEQDAPSVWSPKTEAGARAVPVHPALIEAGLLDLLEARQDQERLLADLRPSGPDQKLGAVPGREFSRLKVKLGVSGKTTFHSFRHSVSTILRNEDAGIRDEWIDAVLGHEGGHDRKRSVGATVYLKRIGARNLVRTVESIAYPPAIMQAWGALLALRHRVD